MWWNTKPIVLTSNGSKTWNATYKLKSAITRLCYRLVDKATAVELTDPMTIKMWNSLFIAKNLEHYSSILFSSWEIEGIFL